MAIKTLRLYPIGHYSLESKSYYPEDTLVENLHLLIAENIPDDDASYIVINSANLGTAGGGIFYSVPQKLTPLAIRVIYRAKSSNSSVLSINALYLKDINNPEGGTTYVKFGEVTLTSSYENYTAEVPQENLASVYKYLSEDYILSRHGQIGFNAELSGSSKNSADARVTQTYLEIDYEAAIDGSLPQEIYLKENGAWIEKQVYIYQKLNGTWEPADKSVLGSIKYVLDTTT